MTQQGVEGLITTLLAPMHLHPGMAEKRIGFLGFPRVEKHNGTVIGGEGFKRAGDGRQGRIIANQQVTGQRIRDDMRCFGAPCQVSGLFWPEPPIVWRGPLHEARNR